MWKLVEGEDPFGTHLHTVVTENTEEAVGLFFEKEHAELFLEALQRKYWCDALTNSISDTLNYDDIRAKGEPIIVGLNVKGAETGRSQSEVMNVCAKVVTCSRRKFM